MQQQEAYHQKEIENAKNNEMTVVTYPYIEECGEGGWVFDSRTAEVGYKYQLFIKGVPCFEPHKIILQKLTKKEVVQSKIDALFKQAINAIESIASMHPAFAVVKSAPAILGKTIANKLTTKPVQQARRTKLRSNAKR